MRHLLIGIRFGFWSLFLATSLMSSACSDITIEPVQRTGVVQLALVGTSTSGVQYHLRHGMFAITGASTETISTEEDLQADAIRVALKVGDYSITLNPGWFLEAATPDAGVVMVQAVLTSTNPQSFTIEEGKTSSVHCRFRVGDDSIETGSGTLAISVEVDDSPQGAGGTSGIGGTAEGGMAATGGSTSLDGAVGGCSAKVATSVAVNNTSACARLNDGTVECWGLNYAGQLGNGTTTDSSVPVSVLGISDAIQVSVGSARACALLSDGTVRCWGDGYGTVPVTVPDITDATAVVISMVGGATPLTNGSVQLWYGSNSAKQEFLTGTNVAAFSYSDEQFPWFCTVHGGGSIQCWCAYGDFCTLPVPGITDATAISLGPLYACALLSGGSVQCWESPFSPADGFRSHEIVTAQVSGFTDVTAVSVGSLRACAVRSNGSVWCWEAPTGEFNPNSDPIVPVQVSAIGDATSVSVGYGNACVLLKDGSIRCWGPNTYGMLGDGTTTDSAIPVPVYGFSCP